MALCPAVTNLCFAQQKSSSLSKTARYAGEYSYGKDIEKGRIGWATIYPESDSTLLFYLQLNRGAPYYNMGQLYGRIKIDNAKGVFYSNRDSVNTGCKFSIEFKHDSLLIKTIDNEGDCGFGFGVYADGKFKRRSKAIPLFFTDLEGKKVYFKKTKPEDLDDSNE
jgi:hypothetical protein